MLLEKLYYLSNSSFILKHIKSQVKFQKSFNKPMRALVGGTIYRFKNDVKKAKLIEANLGEFELFDMMRIYHEANGLYVNGQKTEALEFFKKSSNYSDTLAVRSILSAVQIYLDNGQKDKAVDVLKSHRKNQPDGLIWAATESLETGENFKFNLPTTYSQMMGEDLYNIGVLYARQNDFESAIAFFRAAETAGVSHVYLLSALAETYALVKDYNTAAELYLQIAKEDKFLVGRESIIGAAFTLNVAGRHDEAEKLLVDALEKDKKYYRYPYILADLLRGQDEFKKAIPYFSQALSVLTEKEQKIKWRILYGRAISYEQTGEWDKAEKDFLEALTLAPNNPDLINYLAYSWVDRGVHLEKALLMLQHAVNLSPNNGYIADSLGWALFRMGKYEEALPILEQAVILMPNEAVINDHVGDVYWKLGREQEAEFQWKHALDFKPSSKDKKMIEAKIEVGYNDALVYLEKKALETKNTSPIKEEPQKHESFINVIRSFFSGFSK